MPDLNDLDHFDEGLPVNPMPASEVRLRGDRMRRRNTVLATVGGVAAAAVFIGTPVAVVASRDSGTDNPPVAKQTGTPTPRISWLHEIPDHFLLRDGFPKANADGSPLGTTPQVWVEEMCGTTWVTKADSLTTTGSTYTGESENTLARTLVLFPDDISAQESLDWLESIVEDCPQSELENAVMVNRVQDLDLGAEASLVISQQVEQGGAISGLFVTELARVGNAVFLNASYGSAGGDQVIEYEADRLRKSATSVLSAMCVFSAEPCEVTSTQATEPAPDPPSSAPSGDLADFPLDMGYPETNGGDGSPVEVTGKPGLGTVELCDDIAWNPEGGTTDVIGVEYAGEAEDFRGRTLALYESESAATAALDAVFDALAACPEEDSDAESGASSVYDTVDGDLGDQSLGWTQRYRTPDGEFDTGLTVYHLVRVGNAIYGSYEYGEGGGSDSSITAAVEHATDQARPIVEAMREL